jgi:hypothetical protein
MLRTLPAYAIIIRCIHERGPSQRDAFAELERRCLWLSPEQMQQARYRPEKQLELSL